MKAKLLNLLKEKNNPDQGSRILDFKRNREKNLGRMGVAALPTLLLVGGIITAISISLTTSIYLYINSTYGANLGLRALSAAKSGVYDGMMKVARNKDFNTSYSLSIGAYSAAVSVYKDTPTVGKSKITSTGSALTRRKKIEAIVSVDSTTGLIKLESMAEAAL